jgi:hypothetical protein
MWNNNFLFRLLFLNSPKSSPNHLIDHQFDQNCDNDTLSSLSVWFSLAFSFDFVWIKSSMSLILTTTIKCYPLKRKMEDNVKVLVTSTPAKLPRTYDRSKCGICLENMLFADRKSRELLRQYWQIQGLVIWGLNDFFTKKLEKTRLKFWHSYHFHYLEKISLNFWSKSFKNLSNIDDSHYLI